MKPDIKLTAILPMVVVVLSFLSHMIDNLSSELEALDIALTIPMVVLAISIPSILAYRKRKHWAILGVLYIVIITPAFVGVAIYGMNIGQLGLQKFITDFLYLTPLTYLGLGTVSLILVGTTILFKILLKRRSKAGELNESSNQTVDTTPVSAPH